MVGKRFEVVCGVDDLLLKSAILGSTAWVSGMANVYPKESARLLELAAADKWTEARVLADTETGLAGLAR